MAEYLIGCDFSQYQPPDEMDYAAMAAGGVAYACARTGDGWYTDPTYAAHRAGWEAAGVPVDAYHYCRSRENATAFAQRIHGLAAPTAGNLIWLDLEDGSDAGVGVAGLRAWIQAVVDELRRLGRRPGIYTLASWWVPRLGSWFPEGAPLWISGFPLSYSPVALSNAVARALNSVGVDSIGAVVWHGWQFTSSGVVPGWGSGVDLSIATTTALADLYPEHFGSLKPAQGGLTMAQIDDILTKLDKMLAMIAAGLFPRGDVPADHPNVTTTIGKIGTPVTSELFLWAARQELERMALEQRGGPAARADVGRDGTTEQALDTLSPDQIAALLGRIVIEIDRRLAIPAEVRP